MQHINVRLFCAALGSTRNSQSELEECESLAEVIEEAKSGVSLVY